MTRITKTQSREQAAEMGTLIELFEHSVVGAFNITKTRETVKRFPQFLVTVSLQQMLPFLSQYAIDPDRVKELSQESWLHDPVIIVEQDGKHYLIDGVHRVQRRAQQGMTTVDAYMIPIAMASRMDPDGVYVKFDWDEK